MSELISAGEGPGDGLLVVVAAASGTGKSTVCTQLLKRHTRAALSVSYTTRPPRGEERDGVHYHFVSEETFEQMIEAGALLEWAKVHGRYYGTGKQVTLERLAEGTDVLLDIDVQGAHQLRDTFGERVVLLFLLPPSWEAMVSRLRGRGTESEADILKRLQTALIELPAAAHFDYLITNEQVDKAVDDILVILRSCRLRASGRQHQLNELITQMKADPLLGT